MKPKTNLFSLALILLFASCNSQQLPENFDFGKIENGIYSNKYFGFNLTLPPDWYIQTRDSLVYKVKDQYKDLVLSGNSKKLQTSIKETKPSTINKEALLTVFRYNVDSAVDINYSILIVANNIKNDPDMQTGKDFANSIMAESKKRNVKRTFNGEPKLFKIGYKDFYEITSEMEIKEIIEGNVKQKMCFTVINGFVFSICFTYVTDKQLEEFNKIIATATFTK
jgi:hypothetical protein